MTRLRGTLAAAAVPLVLLTACAQPAADGAGSAPASSAPASPPDADALVLRTEAFGGFVPPDRVVGVLPQVSVYADGRVISEGPVPAVYPGRALPNLQVQTLSPEQLRELVEASGPAGVRNGTDFGQPNVADAPNTRVTVVTLEGTQTVTVTALHETQAQDPQLTAEQRAARGRLTAYLEKLSGLQHSQSDLHAYAPGALAVLARPWTDPGGTEPDQPAQPWPGPGLPGPALSTNFDIGCHVVTGAAKDTILAAADKANALTPWTAGPDRYLITFRPLLPDEKGCANLKGKA